MTKSEKKIRIVVCIVVIFLASIASFITLDPIGRGLWNIRMFAVQKADDSTSYATKKEVEDACRAMVSSYEFDKLTYLQYNGNDNEEKQSWADQAKMRANKTAATYNNYVLENSFVWAGNVPKDIQSELSYLD